MRFKNDTAIHNRHGKNMSFIRLKSIMLGLIICIVCVGLPAAMKADEISDLEDEISDNEQKYEDIQNQLHDLEAAKDDLQAYITKLNETYRSIELVIDDLDSRIEAKNAEIEETNLKIAASQEQLAGQYEDMKLRIQYLYESSDLDYATVFLSSGSISDIFAQMEYISSVMEYDRQQMDSYMENLAATERQKVELEEQMTNLEALKSEQQVQIANLDTMMDEANANIAAHQEQIADAEAIAQAIEDEIEAQRNTVEKLREEEERRKREEELKRQQAANGITPEKIPYQELDGDIKKLAAIIWCEARGESYEGQLAVATVVMNRVESPRFPNTIEEVIAQKGQFSPYRSGKYAIALSLPTMQQSCIDAATEVIKNGTRLGDWLFFRMKNGIINGTFIGNHVFY